MQTINFNQLDIHEIGSWPLLLRSILFIAILSGSLVTAYQFTAKNSYSILANTKTELDDLKNKYVNDYAIAVNLESYKTQLNTIKKSLSVQLKQIPNDDNITDLLENISQHATTSNLEIRLIKPGIISDNNFYTTYDFTITLLGNYNNLGEFSEKIASMPRMVTIHDFKISIESDSNDSKFKLVSIEPQLNIELQLKIYWLTTQTPPKENIKTVPAVSGT